MTLEENKDMLVFTIDELQDSLINHEYRINRSNTSLEGAFVAQSSISRGRGRERNNSKGRGRSSSRRGCATVLRMSLVEDRIRTPVIQVVTGLINKKNDFIIARNLVIMHMNAGISSMTKEGKAKTSQATPKIPREQCCWHVHPRLSATLSKKFHVTYGI